MEEGKRKIDTLVGKRVHLGKRYIGGAHQRYSNHYGTVLSENKTEKGRSILLIKVELKRGRTYKKGQMNPITASNMLYDVVSVPREYVTVE